jgi:DNA repair exonuclease SbcCD ATPase subunit
MYKKTDENLSEKDEIDNRDIKRIRFELDNLKEDFLEDLEDLQEDFEDQIDELNEKREDVKEELIEELEELLDEKIYLLRDIDDAREELENIGEGAVESIEDAKDKFLKLKSKNEKFLEKYLEKLKEKLEKAKKKAAKRINISVDKDTSEEWRDWSEELGSSVSELIRKSMKFVKNNIGDLSKLEELGENIERAVKESGIEDLADKIEREVEGKNKKPRIEIDLSSSGSKSRDIDRIKKRVRGLIKLQKSLPIDKLAQALNKPKADAENLIYELVDEGIEGTIEEDVFKFTSAPDDVITKINDLIDKL